jgi:hypothetical protein
VEAKREEQKPTKEFRHRVVTIGTAMMTFAIGGLAMDADFPDLHPWSSLDRTNVVFGSIG